MNLTDKITITNEDCMELLKRTPDKFYELAIVDPPYGIDIAKWDSIDDRPNKKYWSELFRVSKNQIVFGGNYFTDFLPITKNWLVWDKSIRGKSFLKNRSQFELIWTSLKETPAIFNYTIDGNIQGWDGGKPDYFKKKSIHPTQKTYQVYEFLLNYYAKQGDKILDTHSGSASLAIACHDYGFELTATELDKDYYDASIKRIKNHIAQTKLEL